MVAVVVHGGKILFSNEALRAAGCIEDRLKAGGFCFRWAAELL